MAAEREKELKQKVASLEKQIKKLKKSVKKKKYGLVWMEVPERFEEEAENGLPILREIPEKYSV